MNTRVSWIDPAHLQALVARLSPPEPEIADESASPTEAESDTAPPAAVDFFAPVAPPAPAQPSQAVEHPSSMESTSGYEDDEPTSEPPPPPPVEAAPASAAPAPVLSTTPLAAPPPATAPDSESLPLDRIRERLRNIRHRAVEAGILSHQQTAPPAPAPQPATESPVAAAPPLPVPAPAPTPSPVQELPFDVKIEAFAQQVTQLLPATSWLLILDADGGILWSNDPRPGLVLSTLMALRTASHASSAMVAPPQQLTFHELPPEHILSVLRVPATTHGPLQIAVKGSLPLSQDAASTWLSILSTF